MNWLLAINRNRAALLAVAAAILALIGEGGHVARSVRSAALALLRPAESAVRRLIVIAARGLAVTPREARSFILSKNDRAAPRSPGDRPPAFPLFDRRKRFGKQLHIVQPPRGIPRIRSFWAVAGSPLPAAPASMPSRAAGARPDPAQPVDINRLRLRLASLERALADLPGQARRLARWRARRAAMPDHRLSTPLRIGHPPGHRQRAGHEIDHVLRDCHALALAATDFNTS